MHKGIFLTVLSIEANLWSRLIKHGSEGIPGKGKRGREDVKVNGGEGKKWTVPLQGVKQTQTSERHGRAIGDLTWRVSGCWQTQIQHNMLANIVLCFPVK